MFLILHGVTERMKRIHIHTFQRCRIANWGHSMYKAVVKVLHPLLLFVNFGFVYQ